MIYLLTAIPVPEWALAVLIIVMIVTAGVCLMSIAAVHASGQLIDKQKKEVRALNSEILSQADTIRSLRERLSAIGLAQSAVAYGVTNTEEEPESFDLYSHVRASFPTLKDRHRLYESDAEPWTRDSLPSGYRPLLVGEIIHAGDQWQLVAGSFSAYEWHCPATGNPVVPGRCNIRTTRPLPFVTPDMQREGWIERTGGPIPVPPKSKPTIMYRSGLQTTVVADSLRWQWDGTNSDVVAYKSDKFAAYRSASDPVSAARHTGSTPLVEEAGRGAASQRLTFLRQANRCTLCKPMKKLLYRIAEFSASRSFILFIAGTNAGQALNNCVGGREWKPSAIIAAVLLAHINRRTTV